jgi:HlyD family secretion protein
MFLPIAEMSDTALYYLPSIRKSGFYIYYAMILLVFMGLSSLFFIHVYISVQAPGIVRPVQERTNIRSMVSGIIDSLYFKEGDRVEKNAIILSVRDQAFRVKKQTNEEEATVQKNFIHDLLLLTADKLITEKTKPLLFAPLYREQAARFFSQDAEQRLNLKKANREAMINGVLVKDKVISPKEFFDAQVQQGKIESAYKAFRQEQFSAWQQDLVNCRTKLAELRTQREEFQARKESYCIRAPVSGILQGLSSRYPGSAVQPDETICSVSPEGQLVGECYVSTRDIGMLKRGQQVRFQIDAYNYNYFGAANGNIISIDNDFTMLDNKPVFKVMCRFNEQNLKLNHGYQGQLKKGLTFGARFICTSRTLWQLLYDTMDDWLNPVLSHGSSR